MREDIPSLGIEQGLNDGLMERVSCPAFNEGGGSCPKPKSGRHAHQPPITGPPTITTN